MKNIFAYSFNEFRNLQINFDNTAVIEIVGGNDIENDFIYHENKNVLHIVCDDVDGGSWMSQDQLDMVFDTFINDRMNYDDKCFTNDNISPLDYEGALKLVKFINKVMNDSKIDNIFIHCSAGHSRSQAIVRYINDIYQDINIRKDNPCMTPNMWIVMMLKRVYRNFI